MLARQQGGGGTAVTEEAGPLAGDSLSETGERITITDELLGMLRGNSEAQPDVLSKHAKTTEQHDFSGEGLYNPSGSPEAGDVRQGALGDCYLLAALAAVAKANPAAIQRMITDNGDGTYDVTIYEDKSWFSRKLTPTVVKVDAQFPQYKDGDAKGSPVYAKLGLGLMGIWVMLIEKAYAKHKGSYKAIVGGFGGPAMEAITGKESKRHDLSHYDNGKLFSLLETLLANKQALTAAADWYLFQSTKKEAMNDVGAVLQHEYTVMSVDPGAKTVELRNPWGKDHPQPLTMTKFKKWFRWIDANPTK